MNILLVKTNQPYQKEEAIPISDEELEKRLKANTIRLLDGTVYEEIEADPTLYKTKVMTAEKPAAKQPAKKKPGRPRGRPKKTAAKK